MTQTEQGAAPTADPGCVFCGIVAGSVPAELVASTDQVVAFRDLAPKAPLHVLVVPRAHHPDVAALAAADPGALADLVRTAARVAAGEQAGAGGSGGDHRLVFNSGAAVGQTVFHAHGHVLAGGAAGLLDGDL